MSCFTRLPSSCYQLQGLLEGLTEGRGNLLPMLTVIFSETLCKWLAPSLGELSPLIIHWLLDVSKKSCVFLRAMSPSDLANVFSVLNTVLLISDMLKHVFSLYPYQRLPGWDCSYLWGFAAICSLNLILIPVYVSDSSLPVSLKTFDFRASYKISGNDCRPVLTTMLLL